MILNDGFYFQVVPLLDEPIVDNTIYYAHHTLNGYEVMMEKGEYSCSVSLSYNEVMCLLNEDMWKIVEKE